jgi:hypothetical protein
MFFFSFPHFQGTSNWLAHLAQKKWNDIPVGIYSIWPIHLVVPTGTTFCPPTVDGTFYFLIRD